MKCLEQKTNISLALKVLFYEGNAEKTQENDTGTLSVALESSKLITKGTPAVSSKFVKEINKILLAAENVQKDVNGVDAFGVPFALLEEPAKILSWLVGLMLQFGQCSEITNVRSDMDELKMPVILYLNRFE